MQIITAADLKEFSGDGYCFNGRESTTTEWLFIKEKTN